MFLALGYLILIEKVEFSMSNREILENSARIAMVYIAIQGIGYITQKPGNIPVFLLDLFFSTLPLGLGLASLFFNKEIMSDEWYFFREMFIYAALIDVFIFTVAAFILAVYTDRNADKK